MEENKNYHTPIRAVIIGAIGSILITASSVYVALRVGAVPWPTVFATILSVIILRLIFRKTTVEEINIAQTGMTAGAMIGGAIAFTVPALFISNPEIDPNSLLTPLLSVGIAGLILGAILTWIWREEFIIREELPYPIGVACAETIKVSTDGKGGLLFTISAAVAVVFTVLRDKLALIPQAISSKALAAKNITFGSVMMPLALSIGYMIGPLSTLIIMVASIISFNVFIPIAVANDLFANYDIADSFRQNVGLGILVGTGFGILLGFIIRNIKSIFIKLKEKKQETKNTAEKKSKITRALYIAGVAISYIFMCASGVPLIPSILVIALTYITTLMAVVITGQSGIDPFEVFGIIGIIILTLIFPDLTLTEKIMVAAVIAIASGFAGDTMFDYKAGHILDTNAKSQLISQVVGGAVGVVVSAAVFILLSKIIRIRFGK